tara:strand:- start:1989 stop:2387 length:399 start_codon:yes stop_codon:yes gene_type:complete
MINHACCIIPVIKKDNLIEEVSRIVSKHPFFLLSNTIVIDDYSKKDISRQSIENSLIYETIYQIKSYGIRDIFIITDNSDKRIPKIIHKYDKNINVIFVDHHTKDKNDKSKENILRTSNSIHSLIEEKINQP